MTRRWQRDVHGAGGTWATMWLEAVSSRSSRQQSVTVRVEPGPALSGSVAVDGARPRAPPPKPGYRLRHRCRSAGRSSVSRGSVRNGCHWPKGRHSMTTPAASGKGVPGPAAAQRPAAGAARTDYGLGETEGPGPPPLDPVWRSRSMTIAAENGFSSFATTPSTSSRAPASPLITAMGGAEARGRARTASASCAPVKSGIFMSITTSLGRRPPSKERECLLPTLSGGDGISRLGEEVDEQHPDVRVIVDDQDIGELGSVRRHQRLRPALSMPTRRYGG